MRVYGDADADLDLIKPKEVAIITEVDGTVSFGKDTKGKRRIVVTPEDGDPQEYLIPKGKNITVNEGDYVRAGEGMMDGAANPHDILAQLMVLYGKPTDQEMEKALTRLLEPMDCNVPIKVMLRDIEDVQMFFLRTQRVTKKCRRHNSSTTR